MWSNACDRMKERGIVKFVIIVILLCANIITVVCCTRNILNHLKNFALLKDNDYSFESFDETSYFAGNNITSLSMEEIFQKGKNDCLIYFYSPTCSACKQTNEYISAFIYYGMTQQIDIYFVDISQNQSLVTTVESTSLSARAYKIAYTPTILQFENEEVKEYIGPDEIFELLDSYAR